MNRDRNLLLIVALMLSSSFFILNDFSVYAQPGDDDSAMEVATPEAEAASNPIGEIIEAASEIPAAKEKGPKALWILILSIVSLSIKFIVDLAHGPLLKKGKALKWVAIILGSVAGGVSILVSGLQGHIATVPAILMFLTGPLAIALHELSEDVPILAQISEFLILIGKKSA